MSTVGRPRSEDPLVYTIRTPRAAVCTADAAAALDHFRKASDSGLRPVATRFGGQAVIEKEMERYAAEAAEVYRVGYKARRGARPD